MRRIYLRGSAALLSVLLFGQLVQPGLALAAPAAREGGVTIDEEHFPDQAFRAWLTDRANLNGAGADSFLSAEELAAIQQINVSNQRISSLKGIELFPALQQLSCKDNSLTELDVSRNTQLNYLQCSSNSIRSLDVSGLNQLVALYCESNHMTGLNLTGATALEVIYCRNNDLPSVDFSTNTKLKFIESFDNNLTQVDLSMLKDLQFIHLDHNLLTTLDLSQNTGLSPIGSGFVARNNHLETLILPDKSDLTVDPDVYAEQDPKEGYERVEWYTDSGFLTPVTGTVQAQGQTLYAKWLPNDYTIYFSANGGRGSMDGQEGVWGQELHLSSNQFTRVGYTFQNWKNTFGDGKTYTDGQAVTNLAGDYQGQKVTLYAQWTPNTYTIKFDATDGSGSLDDLSCTYDQSQALTSASTLTAPEGKEFAGWATEQGGAVRYRDGDTVRNLTGDAGGEVTLYAVWREPVSSQYVQAVEAAFAQYQAEHYTAQDWAALAKLCTDAVATIPGAGGEDAMGNLRDQAITGMAEIATLSDRADQAVSAWKNAHPVTQQVNGHAVDESSAADLRQDVQDALAGLTAGQVESATGLTQPADQEQVLAMAMERAQTVIQGLNGLDAAAAWAEGLGGLSTRATREVTPDWHGAYVSALTAAEAHRANLSNTLLTALETRRDLAQQKGEALTQLQSDYESYDLSRYSEDNQAKLASIWKFGADSIRQADSAAAVSSALSGAQSSLKAVPTKDQAQKPGGGGSIGGGGGIVAPQPSTPPAETVPPTEQPTESTVTDPVSGATAVVTTGSAGISAQITHPKPGTPAVLTIPAKASPSTVAVLVAEDGTRTVLPWSVPTADGLELRVSQSCRVELEERSTSYSDVQGQSWYGDAVAFTSARGLFSGVGGGQFAPEQTMSRSMLASVLYRIDGAPAVSGGSSFTDVPDGRWDSQAVQWAAQAGIVSGTGEGKFAPEAPMTREALVTMLYRYANQAGLVTGRSGSQSFSDADRISPWAADAVNWACSAGILQGDGSQLRPDATATRAEVASILMRFTNLVVGSGR